MAKPSDSCQSLCDTIKIMVSEELGPLIDFQKSQDEKNTEMSKAMEDMSAKIVAQAAEGERLRENLQPLREEFEAFGTKMETQLGEAREALKAQMDEFQEGYGIKELYEKMTNLEAEAGNWKAVDRLAKENNLQVKAFGRDMEEFRRQIADFREKVDAVPARLAEMEGTVSTVSLAQEALEDSVSRKYEKLWTDLMHAIDEMRETQMEELKSEIINNQTSAQKEAASLVGHAMTFMASAHTERRKMVAARSLLVAWKDQMMISARRRMGITLLHKMLLRRERNGFDSWRASHKIGTLCDRLNSQYTEQLKDVYEEIKAGDTQLNKRCDRIDSEVATHGGAKADKRSLDDAVADLRKFVNLELQAIQELQTTQQDHGNTIQKHAELHGAHMKTEDNLGRNLSVVGQDLATTMERIKVLADKTEVKSMISDILMIWNSIKQLDTSKADKKDVDSFALETGNRDKLALRRLEDFEADLASKSKQETLRVQEKWTDLEGRVDESARQFRHWEQMWEKLSGFVEDLVAKVGDLQATSQPNAGVSVSASRAGGGWKERGMHRSGSERRPDTTRKPLPRASGGTAETGNAKNLWLSGAKGIVDATIDQALTIRCSCGNVFMDDSNFCRQCGKPRAEAVQDRAGQQHIGSRSTVRSRPGSAPGTRVPAL
jgi:hypothetical protein